MASALTGPWEANATRLMDVYRMAFGEVEVANVKALVVTLVFVGRVIRADFERRIDDKVASGAAKVMDRAYARNRMRESRG